MKIEVEKILEYHDLFPEDKIDLDINNTLKKYNRELLIKASIILSHNYKDATFYNSINTLFSEKSAKHIDDLNTRYQRFLNSAKVKAFRYCSTRGTLELMRRIFAIPTKEYKDNGCIEDLEYDLFRVILQLNEDLTRFSHNKDLNLATITFLLFFVTNDITNQHEKIALRRQLNLFYILEDFIINNPRCKSAVQLFFQKTGISKISEYTKAWLYLVVLEEIRQREQGTNCHILDGKELVDIGIKQSILDFLSIDINQHIPYSFKGNQQNREDNTDYRTFRSHPLIHIGDKQYIIYNKLILIERLYNSMFFDLKEGFDGNAFNFYNTEFVERRLFQQQILKCLNKKWTSHFFPSEEIIVSSQKPKEEKNQPDFYIRESNNIILFECKAIRINGDIKDKADVDELLNTLKNKLYESTHNIDSSRKCKHKVEPVGVKQLVQLIKLIDEDTFKWDKSIPESVTYYPVLVLEDSHLVVPGMSYIVNEWYKNLVNELLPRQMCQPVVVMSIDTLITYSHIFKRDSFHFVFNHYFQKAVQYSKDGVEWLFDPIADFDIFMKETYSLSKRALNKPFDNIQKSILDKKRPKL